MVRLENVTKKFATPRGFKHVLNNVTIEFPTDRSIGIIGKNGAGKSTLVRILSGSLIPNSGQVTRLVRLSWPLGFIGGFPGSSTAFDTIKFVSRIYGQNWREILRKVEDFAELGDYLEMPVATYSSGMRSRLSFGLSFAIDFDCYLMDEILGVGDARFRKKADQVISDRFSRSKMMLVSHSAQQLKKYCQSGAVLLDGKLHYFDEISEALDFYEVSHGIKMESSSDEP